MAKQYRNPEKTKADLLKAAGDLLVEKGLRGFSVHEVAERAGFGKPLVYRYFGARGAVLDALAQAKADEIKQRLKETNVPEGVSVSQNVFQQIAYARILAGDPVLRALFRALLAGELGTVAAQSLDDLIPKSGTPGDVGAAEAFLLGGISYVLLLRDSQTTCAGVPIESPNDMAAFERAFVALCSKI